MRYLRGIVGEDLNYHIHFSYILFILLQKTPYIFTLNTLEEEVVFKVLVAREVAIAVEN